MASEEAGMLGLALGFLVADFIEGEPVGEFPARDRGAVRPAHDQFTNGPSEPLGELEVESELAVEKFFSASTSARAVNPESSIARSAIRSTGAPALAPTASRSSKTKIGSFVCGSRQARQTSAG